MSDLVQEAEKKQICFIFQDESRVEIPLSILEQYPRSLLSLTYASSNNYLRDEDAYSVDCMPLAIEKVAHFLNNSKSLSSLTMPEVISIYNTLKTFFGDESYVKMFEVEKYLNTLFKEFCDLHNCNIDDSYSGKEDESTFVCRNIFTEEETSAFLEYSCLFDFLDIQHVILVFNFDETIRYEYIYPSNLHNIFPKLEEYTLNICYYAEKKEICITPSDPHYKVLYKEYKLLNYKENNLDSYRDYIYVHPEPVVDGLTRDQIYVKGNINRNLSKRNISFKSYIEEERKKRNSTPENIYKELNKEMNDENNKINPDLCIQSLSDYSYEYNNKKSDLIKQQENNICKTSSFFTFTYIDSNKLQDYDHPFLKHTSKNVNILQYVLNIPICKQLKNCIFNGKKCPKLEVTISPMLKALQDGQLDSIQTMNIMNFIQIGSYDEYKQIFKDIITTRVFPNVTTLFIECPESNYAYIKFQAEYLSLFTREHFPQLHIYDLRDVIRFTSSPSMTLSSSLLPDSLMKLMNRIILSDDEILSYILYDNALNQFIKAYQINPFIIKTSLMLNNYIPLWDQLNELGALDVDTIIIDNCMGLKESILPSHDFHKLNIKNLYLNIILGQSNRLLPFHNMISTIHCINLEKVSASIRDMTFNPENNNYLSEFLTDLCTLNYKSVKTLEFNDGKTENGSRFGISSSTPRVNANQDEINQKTTQFLSLFSETPECFDCLYILKNCMQLPIWRNIRELTLSFKSEINIQEALESLINVITSHQLPNLNSLTLLFKLNNMENIPLTLFMNIINENSSIYGSHLKNFKVIYSFNNNFFHSPDYTISNVLYSYPSLCHSLHKPVLSIDSFCLSLKMDEELCSSYCQYLFNELLKDYSKNVQYIKIYVENEESMNTIVNKVIKGDYPFLKKLHIINIDMKKLRNAFEQVEQLLENYKKTSSNFFEYSLEKTFF
ncbi:hypothetical protein WA158_008012 [Blastocystis sp. Blastoise]